MLPFQTNFNPEQPKKQTILALGMVLGYPACNLCYSVVSVGPEYGVGVESKTT